MQPTGGITPKPPYLEGNDKTIGAIPEKGKTITGQIPFNRRMAFPQTQSDAPSKKLHANRIVKSNQGRAILGQPYSIAPHRKASVESDHRLQLPQVFKEMLALQGRSSKTSLGQHNHPDNSSMQVLINLIKQGNTEKVKECIANNALYLTSEDADGNSVLHLAVLHGQDDLCQLFINKARYLLLATNKNGERPLHIAARRNQNNCLKLFLDNLPNLSLPEKELFAKDKSGATPVHLAARYGNKTGLMVMLDYEISEYVFLGPTSPIRLAIKNGHTECMAVILNSRIMDFLQQPYYRALHYAVECGQLDCVKWLLQTYPDSVTSDDPDSDTFDSLIQLAVKRGYDDILQNLLEQPFFINRLTKIGYTDDFLTNENDTCAKLIRDARKKARLPFCPVKNFDKKLFQQTLQQEKVKIAKNTPVTSPTLLHSLPDLPESHFSGSTPFIDFLPQVKALVSGLQEIGVYVPCAVDEDTDAKGQFWTMGDATASIGLIKSLVALGVKTVHAQLSPPDGSSFITRQSFNIEQRSRYKQQQRIALSKLAYLIPGINIKRKTQEIYINDTKVIISVCSLRRENKINAALTLSFLEPEEMYRELRHVQESYITLKPYRFYSECESMYLDTSTSLATNKINDNAIADSNITLLHLPVNSIIPNNYLLPQETEISAINSHTATLISAINQLCDLSANGKIQTSVVYGLHHSDLRQHKHTILTNWLRAIHFNQGQIANALPVVVTTTVSAFLDMDEYIYENGKSALQAIAKMTGFTLIDFRDQQDRAAVLGAGKGQLLLCLMPSLPRQSFNQLVQSSRFPVLCEGANLTTTLLQKGQPHLSLLPFGLTPVAQDMGGPLEALKALAFSCKLRMKPSSVDIKALKILSGLVRASLYAEALCYIDEIKALHFESGVIHFVWADPQPSPLQLRSVTIMSLLHKGKKMGGIEKKALLAALDPSDKALADYINNCLDKNSITNHHFRLQQMHVNKPFNNKV
ncbi:ankyrin repeat domain-containing protein, partial [Endozoicomonas sp. ONNA2]|uniref:ankyrin repeat domain-containing protein n=1 Tax=Endozoicomonas sp. ONNA2 TaxID=2828741 RepID=UPI00214959C1